MELTNQEAWKRVQFADQLRILKSRIASYEAGELTNDALINAVGVWYKLQTSAATTGKTYDPQLEVSLRREWMETGDIEVFRKYATYGMNQRAMGRVCGVSASAISRWLNGQRTRQE